MKLNYSRVSAKEKSRAYFDLLQTPGWGLLQQTFYPNIFSKITDVNAKEQFLYEAIRFQVLQELFNTPRQFILKILQEKEGISEGVSLLEKTWQQEWNEQWCNELSDEELDSMSYEEFEELMGED